MSFHFISEVMPYICNVIRHFSHLHSILVSSDLLVILFFHFQFLAILEKVAISICVHVFYGHMFSNQLVKPSSMIGGVYVKSVLILEETAKFSSIVAVPFFILTSSESEFLLLSILTSTWNCCFVLFFVLDVSHSLVPNDIEHLFVCLFVISISLLLKCLFK